MALWLLGWGTFYFFGLEIVINKGYNDGKLGRDHMNMERIICNIYFLVKQKTVKRRKLFEQC